MIKNFILVCVIAIAMPSLAFSSNVPEASKSLGLNNNTAKSEILGGGAIVVSGEGFNTYETIRDSDTNYAAKIMDGQHPHGGRLLEDTDTAWSFLAVVNVGGAQNNRSIIWSIGKKSTRGIALLYSKADRELQLAKWTTGDAIETVTSINLSDDHSQYRSILVTCSNNHYDVYVDGENRGTYDGEIAIDREFYQIGSVNEGAFGAQKGLGILIDEIGVWNVALSEDHAMSLAAAFPIWPRILSKNIEDAEFRLSTIKAETQGEEILELTMAAENPVIVVDTTLPDITSIQPTFTGALTIKASANLAETDFLATLTTITINGVQLTNLSSEAKTIKVNADGRLVIDEGESVTCMVDYGETYKLKGVEGSGTLIKTGEGTLRIGRPDQDQDVPNVKGTKIKIEDGRVLFHQDDGASVLEDPYFILENGAQLENYGWPTLKGTMTLKSDADISVFSNPGAAYQSKIGSVRGEEYTITKLGAGRINIMSGIEGKVIVEEGSLSFGSTQPKDIREVEGKGTLEQAGGGVMTISKIAEETSLKITDGTLNYFAKAGRGDFTLGGLEIANGATYRMTSGVDHLTIKKSLYLEGERYKFWYVTLEDGAVIATNPENPMVLAGLEFGDRVVLGKDQLVGTTLAKVIKPRNMPSSVTNIEESLKAIPFALEYRDDSLLVSRPFKVELETVPGQNLDAAKYKIHLKNLPSGFAEGDIRVRITTPYATAIANVKKHGGDWYAELSPSVVNEAKGGAYKIKIEIGVSENNKFMPIEEYSDISLNVRPPEEKNDKWLIKELSYDRWATGTWDTEGEYITISDGYVQIEGAKVSFVPGNPNEEAATKLHFAAKFGEGMQLEILNALAADGGQIAGVALMKDDAGELGYAVLDPATNEYVAVTSSDLKPIDIAAEHLVEVTLTKNGVAYAIDGVALVTKDDKATSVFALPKNASIEIAEIDFVGKGAVKSMTAEEYSTKLAKLGNDAYDTVEKAIIAATEKNPQADTITIEPLWNASWVPTPELRDKVIVFKGGYKVIPDTISSNLAENNMVLRENADGSYSVISKFLTITIPDPEDIDGFGVFLESVTTNSMHLGWVYEYPSSLATATVVYDDDVTISFSTTIEDKGLLVDRNNTSNTLEKVTFNKVRYNINVTEKDIPVLDKDPVVAQQTMAKFGIAKQDVAKVESAGILDFTTAADGVTFTVGLLDAQGNDITKIVSEQIGEMVWFSTDLQNWKPVGAENVEVVENEEGVKVLFAQQKDTTTGFYKVVIPSDAK